MADAADLLDDRVAGRPRWPVALGAAVLLGVVGGGALVRSTLPPPPLAVDVADLDGTVLSGDSYVRFQLQLQTSGVQALGDVRLTLGGTTQRGVQPRALDGDGRATVQVELAPACTGDGSGDGLLEVELRDTDGRDRLVRLDVPTDARLDGLLAYPCR